jgi:hypothetical protein
MRGCFVSQKRHFTDIRSEQVIMDPTAIMPNVVAKTFCTARDMCFLLADG